MVCFFLTEYERGTRCTHVPRSLSAGLNVSAHVTLDNNTLLSSVVEDRHPLGSGKWEASSMGGCQSVPTARHSTARLLCRVLLQRSAEDGVRGFSQPFVTSQRADFQNCAFEHPVEKQLKGKKSTTVRVWHNRGCSKTKEMYFCTLSKVKTVFNFCTCSACPQCTWRLWDCGFLARSTMCAALIDWIQHCTAAHVLQSSQRKFPQLN